MRDTSTAFGCGGEGGKNQAHDRTSHKWLISSKLVAAWYRLGLRVPGLEPPQRYQHAYDLGRRMARLRIRVGRRSSSQRVRDSSWKKLRQRPPRSPTSRALLLSLAAACHQARLTSASHYLDYLASPYT